MEAEKGEHTLVKASFQFLNVSHSAADTVNTLSFNNCFVYKQKVRSKVLDKGTRLTEEETEETEEDEMNEIYLFSFQQT